MPTSIYAMRENILALKGEVDSLSEWLADNASNPKTPLDDIRAKQTKLAEINERHEIACKELKRVEDGQKAALLEQERSNPTDAQASEIKLRAAFIRAAARGETEKARSIAAKLGAIPAGDSDLGGGESFLPANISRELISEPLDENPLRQVVPVTNITGLVLPRIAYTVDDDDFVTDEEVAKEMALSGDSVSFGRFKTKVEAKISDTVMYGTDADLVSYVQNALQSGLASKEKKQLFSQNLPADEAHMSFYSTANNLKVVEGATLYEAIVAGMGDLNDAFAENAVVIMRRDMYLAMIKDLANGNATLFGAPPKDVLGTRVIFCDKAVRPIVGDARYLQINYDIAPKYDSDKNVSTGDFIFVLTVWIDIRFKLKSAFRIVAVSTAPIITIVSHPYNKVVTEGAITGGLTVAATVSNGTLTYQWYKNTTSATTGGSAVSGATAASLTIPTDLTEGDHYYYCVVGVSGTSITKTTESAKVTVVGE